MSWALGGKIGQERALSEACDIPGTGASGNLLRAGFAEAGRSVGWRRPADTG